MGWGSVVPSPIEKLQLCAWFIVCLIHVLCQRDEWNKTGNVHINLVVKRVPVIIVAVENSYLSFITYSKCVSEALVIQHLKHLRRVLLSFVACLTVLFFVFCWLYILLWFLINDQIVFIVLFYVFISILYMFLAPRWCNLGFFQWFLPTKPCALMSTQPLKMNTRDLLR
jgi:hypothetical protein